MALAPPCHKYASSAGILTSLDSNGSFGMDDNADLSSQVNSSVIKTDDILDRGTTSDRNVTEPQFCLSPLAIPVEEDSPEGLGTIPELTLSPPAPDILDVGSPRLPLAGLPALPHQRVSTSSQALVALFPKRSSISGGSNSVPALDLSATSGLPWLHQDHISRNPSTSVGLGRHPDPRAGPWDPHNIQRGSELYPYQRQYQLPQIRTPEDFAPGCGEFSQKTSDGRRRKKSNEKRKQKGRDRVRKRIESREASQLGSEGTLSDIIIPSSCNDTAEASSATTTSVGSHRWHESQSAVKAIWSADEERKRLIPQTRGSMPLILPTAEDAFFDCFYQEKNCGAIEWVVLYAHTLIRRSSTWH